MLSISLFSLFLAGLFGGGHCLGMCGGIVAALSFHLPRNKRFQYLLGLNAGRLAGYLFIGIVMGALGSSLYWSRLLAMQLILQAVAAIILLLLGLYIAGLSNKISMIEKIGVPIWRIVQPVLQRCLPLQSYWQTLPAGFLWGGLPCGLVYTAAISALASASWWDGLLCMLAFGVGTLPNLLLMGVFAARLRAYWQNKWIKLFCGLLISLFALGQLGSLLLLL